MEKIKRTLIDLLEVVIAVTVISFVLLKFVLFPVGVEGTSMVPTLQDGDFGYSFIITKNIGISRFDIVVIDPDETDKLLVKRVIGMPNETLEYRGNVLYINDERMSEDFLGEHVITDDFYVELGEDEYYCLGDNRKVSRDSRSYGPFSSEQMVASHVLTVYPFSNFGVKK